MADVDFLDLDRAEAWLGQQSIEMRSAMTSRAALRVLANVGQADMKYVSALTITSFRCTLISAVRGMGRTADLDWWENVADSAAHSALSTADSAFSNNHSADSAFSAAHSAAHSALSALSNISADSAALSAAHSAANSTFSAFSAAHSATDSDAQLAGEAKTLLKRSVWGDIEIPSDILKNHRAFLDILSEDAAWAFWHDWYLAMWEGTFTDWELAFEVIKIADDVWENGAEAVAAEIERIRATLALQAEIASLKEELKAKTIAPSSGHNQGPPLDDDVVVIQKNLELVWTTLEDLEEEVEKDAPDPSKLKLIAGKLLEISAIIAKYCGGKVDIALNKAFETIGEEGTKWGVRYGAAAYVSTNDGVQSVAKATLQFVKTLAGG